MKWTSQILIALSVLNLSSCATNSLINNAKSLEHQYIYIYNYVNGSIYNNEQVYLCFNGNFTDMESDLSNYHEIEKYEFLLTFQLTDKQKSSNSNRIYQSITQSNIMRGCDSIPSNNRIEKIDQVYKNNNESYEQAINRIYKNISVFELKRDSIGSVRGLYLSLEEDMPHTEMSIFTDYYVEGSECNICYAAIPFTVLFDILTSPFQLIGFIALASGH